jgi:hypothetical protein
MNDLPAVLDPFGKDAKYLNACVGLGEQARSLGRDLDGTVQRLCPEYCLTGRNSTFYNELKRRIVEIWS